MRSQSSSCGMVFSSTSVAKRGRQAAMRSASSARSPGDARTRRCDARRRRTPAHPAGSASRSTSSPTPGCVADRVLVPARARPRATGRSRRAEPRSALRSGSAGAPSDADRRELGRAIGELDAQHETHARAARRAGLAPRRVRRAATVVSPSSMSRTACSSRPVGVEQQRLRRLAGARPSRPGEVSESSQLSRSGPVIDEHGAVRQIDDRATGRELALLDERVAVVRGDAGSRSTESTAPGRSRNGDAVVTATHSAFARRPDACDAAPGRGRRCPTPTAGGSSTSP